MKIKHLMNGFVLSGALLINTVMAADCGSQSKQGMKTEQALRAFYAGDIKAMDSLLADTYIQHSNAKDGKEALLAVLEKGRKEGWLNAKAAEKFKPMRTVSDGGLAATHYLDEGEDKVYIDIFRFNEAGEIMEHWDISQKNAKPNRSGRTMIDGVDEADCSVSEKQQTKNKAVVQQLHSEYFAKNNKVILPEIMHESYLQHNPHGSDGRAFFSGLVDRMGGSLENKVHRLIADGDLVYAHVEWPGENWASIDIYRMEDGKIAEHWDVLQDIPAELPHGNGFF